MLRFPKDFVWGSSTSGPQTEGRVAGDGKGDNLWDYWYQVEPNRYYNGIGPDKTSTFYANWEQDIELLLETGHTAFRTSIQWSRIFPQGRGEVNPQGVDFTIILSNQCLLNCDALRAFLRPGWGTTYFI